MSDTPEPIEVSTPEKLAAITRQASPMPLFYFNYLRAAVSFYDLRLFLGRGETDPVGKTLLNEEMCAVVSLEFAKTLRDKLSEVISTYEAKFGALRAEPKAPAGTLPESPTATARGAAEARSRRKPH